MWIYDNSMSKEAAAMLKESEKRLKPLISESGKDVEILGDLRNEAKKSYDDAHDIAKDAFEIKKSAEKAVKDAKRECKSSPEGPIASETLKQAQAALAIAEKNNSAAHTDSQKLKKYYETAERAHIGEKTRHAFLNKQLEDAKISALSLNNEEYTALKRDMERLQPLIDEAAGDVEASKKIGGSAQKDVNDASDAAKAARIKMNEANEALHAANVECKANPRGKAAIDKRAPARLEHASAQAEYKTASETCKKLRTSLKEANIKHSKDKNTLKSINKELEAAKLKAKSTDRTKVNHVVEAANSLPIAECEAYVLFDSWFADIKAIEAFEAKGYCAIGALKTNCIIYSGDVSIEVKHTQSAF
jgi:hypothetical protein